MFFAQKKQFVLFFSHTACENECLVRPDKQQLLLKLGNNRFRSGNAEKMSIDIGQMLFEFSTRLGLFSRQFFQLFFVTFFEFSPRLGLFYRQFLQLFFAFFEFLPRLLRRLGLFCRQFLQLFFVTFLQFFYERFLLLTVDCFFDLLSPRLQSLIYDLPLFFFEFSPRLSRRSDLFSRQFLQLFFVTLLNPLCGHPAEHEEQKDSYKSLSRLYFNYVWNFFKNHCFDSCQFFFFRFFFCDAAHLRLTTEDAARDD